MPGTAEHSAAGCGCATGALGPALLRMYTCSQPNSARMAAATVGPASCSIRARRGFIFWAFGVRLRGSRLAWV